MTKKQLHVNINENEIIIDVCDDESVSIYFDQPPTKFTREGKEERKPTIRVEGLRWRNDEHFHLGWFESSLKTGDKISIQMLESDCTPSGLTKEEKYIEPEIVCSFCQKPASKVKHIVDSGIFARICDECVKLCQKAIDEKHAT